MAFHISGLIIRLHTPLPKRRNGGDQGLTPKRQCLTARRVKAQGHGATHAIREMQNHRSYANGTIIRHRFLNATHVQKDFLQTTPHTRENQGNAEIQIPDGLDKGGEADRM